MLISTWALFSADIKNSGHFEGIPNPSQHEDWANDPLAIEVLFFVPLSNLAKSVLFGQFWQKSHLLCMPINEYMSPLML